MPKSFEINQNFPGKQMCIFLSFKSRKSTGKYQNVKKKIKKIQILKREKKAVHKVSKVDNFESS